VTSWLAAAAAAAAAAAVMPQGGSGVVGVFAAWRCSQGSALGPVVFFPLVVTAACVPHGDKVRADLAGGSGVGVFHGDGNLCLVFGGCEGGSLGWRCDSKFLCTGNCCRGGGTVAGLGHHSASGRFGGDGFVLGAMVAVIGFACSECKADRSKFMHDTALLVGGPLKTGGPLWQVLMISHAEGSSFNAAFAGVFTGTGCVGVWIIIFLSNLNRLSSASRSTHLAPVSPLPASATDMQAPGTLVPLWAESVSLQFGFDVNLIEFISIFSNPLQMDSNELSSVSSVPLLSFEPQSDQGLLMSRSSSFVFLVSLSLVPVPQTLPSP